MLTSAWNNPISHQKVPACLTEDRHNPHSHSAELNSTRSVVTFPWKTSLLGFLKTCKCKNQEENLPDWLTGTSVLGTPISQEPAAQLGWGAKARISPGGPEMSTSICQGSCIQPAALTTCFSDNKAPVPSPTRRQVPLLRIPVYERLSTEIDLHSSQDRSACDHHVLFSLPSQIKPSGDTRALVLTVSHGKFEILWDRKKLARQQLRPAA